MSDAKAYYHPGFLFASIDAKRDAQDTTPLRKIAFLVFPDFEILDLCGPLDVFVYADRWLRYSGRVNEPGYEVQVIAATSGLIKPNADCKSWPRMDARMCSTVSTH